MMLGETNLTYTHTMCTICSAEPNVTRSRGALPDPMIAPRV
jgi:hypothetical protein